MGHDPVLWEVALQIINQLAPLTRRDDWWVTEGPREIIYEALVRADDQANCRHAQVKEHCGEWCT